MSAEEPPKPSPESASLVHRLAGPSVTKAGLAHDQTEINRIIAEVSKGSKFYENEKRKDKELTDRIQKLLKVRDDVMRGVDIHRIEADVDKTIDDLENQRDLSQHIVHVDMDAFYASVELMYNPELKDKPFGVGKGVLTTASYEARKYGVRSGMAGFVAKRLCPDLVLLPINFARYSEMSKKVMSIFKQYDPNMLVAGCDEGYLNITNYCREHNIEPEACVLEMRQKVNAETKLTVSAGIASNKMLAKICSDKNKPNGQFFLKPDSETIRSFMKDLSIRKLPGVGRVNERLLDSIGIKTCGDIYKYRATVYLMDKYFGLNYLLRAYLGIASNSVQPYLRDERKSISAERTFSPLEDQELILQKLDEVATELEKDMEQGGWVGKTVTLKYKLDTYQVFSRAKSFDRWISKKTDLFNVGKDILKSEFPLRLRLVGLRVNKLKDLRIKDDKGIKRFFDASGSSPRKKQKTNYTQAETIVIADDEDAMPGYDDEEAWDESIVDEDAGEADDDEVLEIDTPPIQHTKKPHSEINLPKAVVLKPKSKKQEARPTNHDRQLETTTKTSIVKSVFSASGKSKSTCPICAKEFYIDNAAFNAHIDFCLSKGVIMEATSAAPSSSKKRKFSKK